MGLRSSRLTLEGRLRLVDGAMADSISLSRPRSRGCCGRGRRTVASFTFRKGAERGTAPLASDQAASLHFDKLAALDEDTPIRVHVLAGRATVFRQDMPLRDFLQGVRFTMAGRHAVLFFSLAGSPGGVEGQGRGSPALFCNGKRVGARPEAPQEHRANHVPEAGEVAGPAPEAGQNAGFDADGQVVEATLQQEASPAPEDGLVVEASQGQEDSPVSEAAPVMRASPEQEASPAPQDGLVVEASQGQEACPPSEADLAEEVSLGHDGLGPWVSVPSLEEGQEEASGAAIPEEGEEAGIVHRKGGEEVMDPSPPTQHHPRQPGRARLGSGGAGGRLSYGPWPWDNLLSIAQTMALTLLACSTLLEYFSG